MLTLTATNVEQTKAWVVVTDDGRLGHPRANVGMLNLSLGCQAGADIHVVELLAVHIEDVGVSLNWGDSGCLVEINKSRFGGKSTHGLHKGEFIEITSHDNTRLGVSSKNLADEVL
jgi:hypothetical protein